MCNIIDDKDVNKYVASHDLDDEDEEVERLKNLGLDDNEIDEVLKGNQSEDDFIDDPDEDFEDDDYYGEDDI